MPTRLHPLLERQLRHLRIDPAFLDPAMTSLMEAVSGAYADADADRTLAGRALEISSSELADESHKFRHQRDLFRSFMDNSPLLAYMKDGTGRYTYVNRKFGELAGRGASAIVGKTDAELFAPEFVQKRQLSEGEAVFADLPSEVLEEWPASGKMHEWRVSKFLIEDPHGQPQVGSIGLDVTERRLIEEQLRQSQKLNAIGSLAGGIAHDFNNLLTVILGYALNVQECLPAQDPAHDSLEEIIKAGERAADLTKQLLVFGRKQVVQLKRLILDDVLADMEKMLRRLIGEDIHLTVVRMPHASMVRADAGQVQQVVMNLALNARDAMPRGGRLTVETKNVLLDDAAARRLGLPNGEYVMLAVSDTGTGMTPEVRARLFEPFFTTKRVGEGTGLGLATVYGIVTQAQGQITVYTEIGHGSTFKIYFPRVKEDRPTDSHLPDRSAIVGGSERILVVEDEESVRGLLLSRLASAGYEVFGAGNGTEALQRQQSSPRAFELVITDIVMPLMGGVELINRLRTDTPDLRVIYMSGYPDGAMVQRGTIDEDTPFLQKPFSASDLLRKVREVLDADPRPVRSLPPDSPGR